MSRSTENVYTCEKCAGATLTIDVDYGVTPFMIRCRATPGCKGWAHSGFYRAVAYSPPTFEWYRPDAKEVASLDPATADHVKRGGLLLRARSATPETRDMKTREGTK